MILGIVKNLLFTQQLRAACEAAGLVFCKATSKEKIQDLASQSQLIVVDLNSSPNGAQEFLHVLNESAPDVAIIGFVSHTDSDSIAAAREAGLQTIMPRSKFFSRLSSILEPFASQNSQSQKETTHPQEEERTDHL